MIQRIQSVFLFLVAIGMILVVVFPIWQQFNLDNTHMMVLSAWDIQTINIATNEVIASQNKMFIALLAMISAGIAVFSIFQYKNRTRQMFFNMINSLVMVSNLGLVIWTSHQANETFNPQMNGTFDIGFWAIFAGMILNLLANRFIRKDELLVRSVDRIR